MLVEFRSSNSFSGAWEAYDLYVCRSILVLVGRLSSHFSVCASGSRKVAESCQMFVLDLILKLLYITEHVGYFLISLYEIICQNDRNVELRI